MTSTTRVLPTRSAGSPLAVASALCLLLVLLASPVLASVHLMQIEKVVAGLDGDTTAQAVQLRMRSAGQNFTQNSRLVAWNASGSNPVVLSAPGSSVANGSAGARVLFATAAFSARTSPETVPDFTMNAIPASYLAAGSLTFENSTGSTIYWRLSWGGSGYTGSNVGSTFNDSDGRFGPPLPTGLPTSGFEVVQFSGLAGDLHVSNSTDYEVVEAPFTLVDNAGNGYTVEAATPVPDLPRATPLAVLHENVPNPFNPRTEIPITLERSMDLTLRIYTLDGRRVRTLHEGVVSAGRQEWIWNGRDDAGRDVASGVFLVRMRAGSEVRSAKIALVR